MNCFERNCKKLYQILAGLSIIIGGLSSALGDGKVFDQKYTMNPGYSWDNETNADGNYFWTNQADDTDHSIPGSGDTANIGSGKWFRTPTTASTFTPVVHLQTGSHLLLKVNNGVTATVPNLVLDGGEIIMGNSSGTATLAGAITVNESSSIKTNGETVTADTTIISASISGGSGKTLTLNNAGKIQLTGTNTGYAGNWVISGPTVITNNTATTGTDTRFGSGSITLSGGTIQSGVASTYVLNNVTIGTGTSYLNAPYDLYMAGRLSESGSLTTTGSNSVYFKGDNSDFSGTMTNGGTGWLRLTGYQSSSQNASYVSGGAGILLFDNGSTAPVYKMGSLTGTSGQVRPGYGSKTIDLHVGYLNNDETFSGTLMDNEYQTRVAMSVFKEGTGTWTLDGTCTYTGKTVINGGTLAVKWSNWTTSGFELNNGTLDSTSSGNFYTNLASPSFTVTKGNTLSKLIDSGTSSNNGLNLNGKIFAISVAAGEFELSARVWNDGTVNLSGAGTADMTKLDAGAKVIGIKSSIAKLNANGSTNGALTLDAGILSAGIADTQVGTLTVSSLDADSSTLLFDIASLESFDQLIVTAANGLSWTDNTLINLAFLDQANSYGQYKLISLNGNTSILGDLESHLSPDYRSFWNLTGEADGIYLSISPSVVPEPSAYLLLLLGLGGLYVIRQKKN